MWRAVPVALSLLLPIGALAQTPTPIIGLPLANPVQMTDSAPLCQQSGCTMANSLSSATIAQISSAVGVVVNARQFGAKCDITYKAEDGSISAGSSTLTSASYAFPLSAAHKPIVVFGAGAGPFYPTTVAAYTINAGGTSYAVNDKSTMSDGTVLKVLTETGGVVQTVAIWSSSGESSLPTQPLTQVSSTGSGTGLEVTLTFYGSPLATTISSVSGNTAHLSAPAMNTVSTQDWYYGTDDGAAIQLALNSSNYGTVVLPANCGTTQQIEMPSIAYSNTSGAGAWLRGIGRESSGLYALAPTTAVIDHNTTESYGGGVTDMTVESGGLAEYGIYVQGGHYFLVANTAMRDASGSPSTDIQIGNGTTLVEEAEVFNDHSETNFNALAPGQRPLRNIQYAANANDGWVIGSTLAAAQNENIQFIGGADHMVRIHTFGHAPDYAPSVCCILGAQQDTADGVQIDGATGGYGFGLNAINTTAINILCNGFSHDPVSTIPCVNVGAATPTEVNVSGVTPVSGQTGITIGGNAVPGLLAIQQGYVYDPTFAFSGAGTPVPTCGATYAGRSVFVTDGGTYSGKVAGATYAAADGSTSRTVLCAAGASSWVYN
jgi:hypothetical protein